jgi:hypothetical protein
VLGIIEIKEFNASNKKKGKIKTPPNIEVICDMQLV